MAEDAEDVEDDVHDLEVLGVVLVEVVLHEVLLEAVFDDGIRKVVLEGCVDEVVFEAVCEDGLLNDVEQIVGGLVEGMLGDVFGTQALPALTVGSLRIHEDLVDNVCEAVGIRMFALECRWQCGLS